jgi:hypothetical protein
MKDTGSGDCLSDTLRWRTQGQVIASVIRWDEGRRVRWLPQWYVEMKEAGSGDCLSDTLRWRTQGQVIASVISWDEGRRVRWLPQWYVEMKQAGSGDCLSNTVEVVKRKRSQMYHVLFWNHHHTHPWRQVVLLVSSVTVVFFVVSYPVAMCHEGPVIPTSAVFWRMWVHRLPWHRHSDTRNLSFMSFDGQGKQSKVTCPRLQVR